LPKEKNGVTEMALHPAILCWTHFSSSAFHSPLTTAAVQGLRITSKSPASEQKIFLLFY
jgi:hypothetical protein